MRDKHLAKAEDHRPSGNQRALGRGQRRSSFGRVGLTRACENQLRATPTRNRRRCFGSVADLDKDASERNTRMQRHDYG
ncbi:hypothetical protein XA68_13058 [Ophiocordyceps unilateralis]|uniref:Uncharacterized protein n=1 Tax=Ophiocordyceps unilateralis TaxID=268505 RepID=A0A2A9PBW8_OPHUN|nr:hypothetical protein XA68_13058 [Ophiocordyceps unilateralis]